MKLSGKYILRTLASHHMLLPSGDERVNASSGFSLSSSAAWLYRRCEGAEFTREDLVKWLLEEYDVDEKTASEDVDETLKIWKKEGII